MGLCVAMGKTAYLPQDGRPRRFPFRLAPGEGQVSKTVILYAAPRTGVEIIEIQLEASARCPCAGIPPRPGRQDALLQDDSLKSVSPVYRALCGLEGERHVSSVFQVSPFAWNSRSACAAGIAATSAIRKGVTKNPGEKAETILGWGALLVVLHGQRFRNTAIDTSAELARMASARRGAPCEQFCGTRRGTDSSARRRRRAAHGDSVLGAGLDRTPLAR